MRVYKADDCKVRDKDKRLLVLEITVEELQCLLGSAIDMHDHDEGRGGQLDPEPHEVREVYRKLLCYTYRPAGKMQPLNLGNPHDGY